jgi:hypothetical protein
MTLVSSINNIGSDTEFILRGRSFIQLQTIRGNGTVPMFQLTPVREKIP